MLSRFIIAFLPRSKHLLFSWLQSPFAMVLEPKKMKSVIVSTASPFILQMLYAIIPNTFFFFFLQNWASSKCFQWLSHWSQTYIKFLLKSSDGDWWWNNSEFTLFLYEVPFLWNCGNSECGLSQEAFCRIRVTSSINESLCPSSSSESHINLALWVF